MPRLYHLLWLFISPAARRYMRSTSAASRKDAGRAKHKIQVPNIASKTFLNLKSLALKAYLEVRLELSDLGRLPPNPIILPPKPAHTAKRPPHKSPQPLVGAFFKFLPFQLALKILHNKMTKKVDLGVPKLSPNPPQILPKSMS